MSPFAAALIRQLKSIITGTGAYCHSCCGSWLRRRKNRSAGLRPGPSQCEAQTIRRVGDRRSEDMTPRTKRDSLRELVADKNRWTHSVLLGIGPVDVVRSGVAAVLPDLVRSSRSDHHGVVREIELDGRSPGVHDLAFVVLLGVGGGEDNDFAFGLAGQCS